MSTTAVEIPGYVAGDRLHWVRDTGSGEDRSQARAASGRRIMVNLRNLVIAILRLAGGASIASALRYMPGGPPGSCERSRSANRLCRVALGGKCRQPAFR